MNWVAKFLKALARGMAVLSPDCRQASRLQSEAIDNKLPTLQHIGLRIHLLLCKWCRRYGKQIRFLHDAAHEHPDEMTESDRLKLSEDARARIKQRLRTGK